MMSEKRYLLNTFAFLVMWISNTTCQKPLPTYVVPCSKSAPDFNECCRKHGIDAMQHFLKGDRQYNIPVLNPLVLPSVDLDAGNLKISIKDLHIFGLDTHHIKKAAFDLNNNMIDFTFGFDRLNLQGKYKCDGKILILPIQGEGNLNLTIDGFDVTYHADIKLETKGGDEYISLPEDATVDYTMKNLYINLDNLFGGNKELGDATNKAINDEWEKFADGLKPVISSTIVAIAQSIAGAITTSVPLKNIFLD